MASKQLLRFQPPTHLTFRAPLDKNIKDTITITNNSDERVAFKVKTTAPKQYCVRPSAGVIEPHSSKEVVVLLQPIKEPLPADYKCKDKFQVQTTFMKPDEKVEDLATLWSEWEKEQQDRIASLKLRVLFIQNEGDEMSASQASVKYDEANEAQPASIVANASPQEAGYSKMLISEALREKELLQSKLNLSDNALKETRAELAKLRAASSSATKAQPTGLSLQLLIALLIVVFACGFQIGSYF